MTYLHSEVVYDTGTTFFVDLDYTKTYKRRNFMINEAFYPIVKKYVDLRSANAPENRFFIQYKKGKCTIQSVGINTMYDQSKIVAEFLRGSGRFNGHTMRRTGTTLASNGGADHILLNNAGGWDSDKVSQGYIERSLVLKKENWKYNF